MTSPFKHFRKHQKAMLAVLGILSMIAFTVGPQMLDWVSGHTASRDPVVATANGETLRQSNISQLVQARFLANQFVHGSLVMAYGSEQMAMLQSLYVLQRTPGQFFGSTSEEDVIRTYLLAEEARRVGVVVSDEAVNKFLRDVTQDKVPSDGYASLTSQLKVSQAQLFAALRMELAAERLASMSLPSAQATPAQRWDYYRRLKQRASVEVVPVQVVEFVDEISDPSKEELARFFDAHKGQEPEPLSPTPGFKVPKQAAFQYFTANYDKFYDEAAVTQEEIEKHYEQYKDQKYLYSAFDAPEFEQPAAEEKAKPDESGDAKSETEPAAKADAKPAEEKPSEGKEPEETPAKEESKSAEEKPSEEKPADKKSDQSSLRRGAEQLVSAASLSGLTSSLILADAETETAEKDAAANKPAAESQEGAEKPAVSAEANPAAGSEADAETEKPAEEAPAEVQKLPAGPPPPIADDLLMHRDIREGAKPKYAPLWRVEAAIRKELAGQKAVEKMTKALDTIQAKMRRYSRDLGPDDELEGEEPQKKRSLPDFSSLAAAGQLTEHASDLMSALAFKADHAALADATPEQQTPSERPRHFVEIAYGVLPLFQSAIVKDLAGNRYLVWKTDEKEAYVPELADVRDEVVQSWKMIQARDLAKKRAAALADEARKADKPLEEVFSGQAGLKVTATPAFSWLTRGVTGGLESQAPTRLSEVEGVQDAGPDFMRETFNLGVGETGQAMNQPQTICYVIRVVSLEPSREVLRNLFMVDAYTTYESASVEDRREVVNAWIKGIENEAHLSWKRPPNESQR